MRILLYSHSFAPAVGGVETYAMLLAKGLASFRGSTTEETFAVTLATSTPGDGFDESRLPFNVVRGPGFWQLLRLIRETDLVHLAGPCILPLVISWLIRKPVVVVHHGYQSICPNGLLFKQPSQAMCAGHFMKREYGQCLRCCGQAMGVTDSVRSLLLTFPRRWLCKRVAVNVSVSRHQEARIQLPRARTIYHGVRVVEVLESPCTESPSDVVEFAYVGRFVAEKGLSLLLQAAEHLASQGNHFKLTFIGDGPERTRLERMTRDLKLNELVSFTGVLRGADLDRAVSRVSVVVMPSIWEETAGLGAIEQMMRGRLVIAADVGGLGEVIGNAGLKFAPGDFRKLASCMQVGLNSPDLVASLGSSARNRAVKLFRHESMIESHAAVCSEVSAVDSDQRNARR